MLVNALVYSINRTTIMKTIQERMAEKAEAGKMQVDHPPKSNKNKKRHSAKWKIYKTAKNIYG